MSTLANKDQLTAGVINIKLDFFNRWFEYSREKHTFYAKKLLFHKAEERVHKDTSIFHIVQTISKLKVAVDFLVGRNIKRVQDIKKAYIKKQTVDLDEKLSMMVKDSQFWKFLESDM